MNYYARIKDDGEEKRGQELQDHLVQVSRLTSEFAARFGAAELGEFMGSCHDIGKAAESWQRYLRGQTSDKPDHRLAGALLAADKGPHIAVLPLLGHHGGLPRMSEFKIMSAEAREDEAVVAAMEAYRNSMSALDPDCLPDFIVSDSDHENRRACEFFVRMLFSALVDADYLDTERFMQPENVTFRGQGNDLQTLLKRFRKSQAALDAGGRINGTRNHLYEAVMGNADAAPGFFSLSIPTGGGKTRTAMGFALKHALCHDLDRVIVVIPYTSIIEQTAEVYREIFGDNAVVEHHSSVDPERQGEWNRLASENWAAPIIVTTSVQFFDSLHARKPGRCRKLHNMARSVVVLDEVQTLPPGLLDPTLDIMRELKENYSVSFVFSTATQPAFSDREGFNGLESVRELAPEAHEMFSDFGRVSYEFSPEMRDVTWDEVGRRVRDHRQALVILNTKKDALTLYRKCNTDGTFHLSSAMCPAHRSKVLEDVTDRLEADGACRLVSTQVVEAGVDIDFPVLYRAAAPLDSIVQAAGRCNREGALDKGRAIVFEPRDGGMPPGAYRTAAEVTRMMLQDLDVSALENAPVFRDYFSRLYDVLNTDQKDILDKRARMDYPAVAEAYNLINSDTRPVIVKWGKGAEIPAQMRDKPYLSRRDFAIIQRYSVNMWSYQLKKALKRGLCAEIRSGLYEWCGKYDPNTGVLMESQDPEDFIC